MEEELIGSIKMFAGDFAPEGWMFCNGQLLSIEQHQVLFSILGNSYGGDGIKNFALPDLSGRLPVGFGPVQNEHYLNVGDTGGEEFVTIPRNQIPTAEIPSLKVIGTIKIRVANQDADRNDAVNNALGKRASYNPAIPDKKPTMYQAFPKFNENRFMNSKSVDFKLKTDPLIANNVMIPHMPPYMASNFIIAITGQYPVNPEEKVKGRP